MHLLIIKYHKQMLEEQGDGSHLDKESMQSGEHQHQTTSA